ncbi:hypothetical protein LCGC14_3027880 [marine sediment metagenome]|uniref:Uncharacterized protein n=1 Tax=marine sediment metagenome TaxID=412755 RepID=A0A0F8WT50_9ZZZZ
MIKWLIRKIFASHFEALRTEIDIELRQRYANEKRLDKIDEHLKPDLTVELDGPLIWEDSLWKK